MPTIGTVARLMVEMSAAGVAETGAAVRGVGTEAEGSTAKLGLMKRFMGSFLGQQLIFGLISKAIQVISQNIQDVGVQTNAWDAASAQLGAVLKSTGGAAGVTASQALALADAMSKVSLNNNTATLQAENMLLTFTDIGAKIFPQTTQAVVDMQQAMTAAGKSMSLGDVAIQIGKALQNPILGMTALRREGVDFSAEQVAQVKTWMKTNDLADAQALILKELGREFGGSALAATKTFAGSMQVVNDQMDIVKENIGNAFMPILAQLFLKIAPLTASIGTDLPNALKTAGTFFNDYLKQPLIDVKQVVGDVFGALGTLAGGFAAAAGGGDTLHATSLDVHTALLQVDDVIKQVTPGMAAVGGAIGTLVKALVGITTWATQNKTILLFLGVFIGVILVDALYSMAAAAIVANIALLPEELIFLAIAAAIALLVTGIILLVTHWSQVTKFLGDFAGAVGDFIGNVLGMVGDFADKLIDLYTWPWRTAWDHIGPFVKGLLGFFGSFFGNIIGITLRFDALFLGLLTWPFRFAWAFIQPFLGTVLGAVAGFFGNLIGAGVYFGTQFYAAITWPFRTAWGYISGWMGQLLGWLQGQWTLLVTDTGSVLGRLIGVAQSVWPGIRNAFKVGINDVLSLVNGFIGSLDAISIHIPAISVGPVTTPAFNWGGLGISTIPLLAQGGTVMAAGRVVVGDAGPEFLDLPVGARVSKMNMQGAPDMTKPRGSAGGETHYHVHINASQATAGEVMLQMRKQEMLHRGLVR